MAEPRAVSGAQLRRRTWPGATGSRRQRPRSPSNVSSDDERDWESTIEREAVLMAPLDLALSTPSRERAAAVG